MKIRVVSVSLFQKSPPPLFQILATRLKRNVKILWLASVHVNETSGLGFFEPEVHDGMK